MFIKYVLKLRKYYKNFLYLKKKFFILLVFKYLKSKLKNLNF